MSPWSRLRPRTAAERAVGTATLASIALAIHGEINARQAITLPPSSTPSAPVAEPVSVLIPARNEAGRIGPTLRSLLAQEGVRHLEILVLDDGSNDGTADVVEAIGGDRVSLVRGAGEPPAGWLGKPWACARLAEQAGGEVLVFLDADVVLSPTAVSSAVAALRTNGLALLSPFPRQLARGVGERLVQPWLTWTWLTSMSLLVARHTRSPAFSAAIGQFLVADAAAYRRIGGHRAVRDSIVEDVALMRAMRRSGGPGLPAIGSAVAECRMFDSSDELVDGWARWLHASAPWPLPALGLAASLATYLVPPVAALVGPSARIRAAGAVGYAAGVSSRASVARRTGSTAWPDSLAQPASAAFVGALTVLSWWRHARGTQQWKGRPV